MNIHFSDLFQKHFSEKHFIDMDQCSEAILLMDAYWPSEIPTLNQQEKIPELQLVLIKYR